MSRLKASNSAFGNITFKYDAVGNLRNRTITGGNSLGGSQHNATMNFNNLNQVSSVVTPSGTRSFGYDSRGNVTNNGIYSFSYALANQPTSQGSSIFVYDGNLKRVKKTANGKTVYFVYTKEAGFVMVKYFWRDFKPLFLTHYIFDVESYNLLLNVCVCNCRTGYIAQPH